MITTETIECFLREVFNYVDDEDGVQIYEIWQDVLGATLPGDVDAEDEPLPALRVLTFRDAGLMTRDKGVVVRIGDAEFQMSIKRAR